MELRQQLRVDLREALKAREKEAVTALRILLAAIDNAEAVPTDPSFVPITGRTNDVPRKLLTEADVQQILQAEAIKQREALAECERLGQDEAAKQIRTELVVMSRYLGSENS